MVTRAEHLEARGPLFLHVPILNWGFIFTWSPTGDPQKDISSDGESGVSCESLGGGGSL